MNSNFELFKEKEKIIKSFIRKYTNSINFLTFQKPQIDMEMNYSSDEVRKYFQNMTNVVQEKRSKLNNEIDDYVNLKNITLDKMQSKHIKNNDFINKLISKLKDKGISFIKNFNS